MMTYDEALKYAINGEAVFIIGSGFSVGAKNKLSDNEKYLWVGSQLAKELAKLTGMDLDVQLDIVAQEYIDINGEKQLVEYLKEHYTVETYEEYYNIFSKIKNLRVYSTNYDDLIEKVCHKGGNKVKAYNIETDIRKANKDKMVLHLNGYVNDLKDGILPESFKLSHLSYNNTMFFDTPWYSYLIDELYSTKVIFVVGLSFMSDLDIRRIVSGEGLKDKIFFIEREDLSDSSRKFLDKYGHVLMCGVKNFLEDLARTEIVKDEKDNQITYKSFRKLNRFRTEIKVEDRDLYALFFRGIEKDGIYKRNAARRYEVLVNRDKINDVVENLNAGKSVIIHSDLGNGKSIFVNQVLNLCTDLDFYCVRQVVNSRLQTEIKNLCKSEKKKVIICDPANLFMDILSKFADFDLNNIRFILVMRSPMYDNYYNNFYDIIEKMNNVDFMSAVNLDVLSDTELSELDKLIMNYGFYGDLAGKNEEKRKAELKNRCKSRFQNILIYLFESMHIIDKFIDSIGNLNENSELRRILILTFVSGVLELGFDTNDYKILLDINDVERIIKRSKNCEDFLNIQRGKVEVKSSIIAKELMMNAKVFSKDEVFDVLTSVMKKLDKLYLGSNKYKNAMVNLVSCSYISYVFGYQMDSSGLIEYYENVKELNFCKRNLFFWEQYAIACVNLNQFDRAEQYFKTAYSLAKQRGHIFSAYQIDNHYARYLLENQLYYRKREGSLDVFVEAHRLLNKNSDIERQKKYSRYYKFRVARAYKDYYDAFAVKYAEKEKSIFLKRCREMYLNLLDYKNSMKTDEIRKDVKECEAALKYILESENINNIE